MARTSGDAAGPVVVVGVLAAIAALAGIGGEATYGARTSGDEPQYLLSATSIGEDLDLDVSDEIAERRFTPYHAVDLDPQTTPLAESGQQVSPHDPLLPAILALPIRLGGWVAAKATLAIIAGLTAATATWVAIRRAGTAPIAAVVGVGAAFVGIPLAAYGTQVYPEMPAALAVVAAVAVMTSSTPTWRHQLGALLAIIALPWLAVKYVPIAAVLAVTLVLGVRRGAAPTRRAIALVGIGVVAGATYLLIHRAWYGGWTVYATGDHFVETGEFSVVGTQVDLLGRSRRLAGLLVDQDFGIGAWSPVWLLGPLALGMLTARRWRGRWLAIAVVAAGWLNATFVALTMHGWWVPGRQIVVILPVVAVGLALVADNGRVGRAAIAALGLVGVLNWIWLAVEASTGRRTLIVDFASTTAWPYRAIRAVLPDGLAGNGPSDALLAAWGAAVVATGFAGWRLARGTAVGNRSHVDRD